MQKPLKHFQTFARLHDGCHDDAAALWALSDGLPGGLGGERPVWPALIQAEDCHVLVATEGQLIIGAAVIWHHKDSAAARLAWLGVSSAAQGFGVGQLLVETAIARVGIEGAAVITAHLPAEATSLHGLLVDAGFIARDNGQLRLPIGRSMR